MRYLCTVSALSEKYWSFCFYACYFARDAVPNPACGRCDGAVGGGRTWPPQGQRPGRPLGTRSFPLAQQSAPRAAQPLLARLPLFPTKSILEWFYILLWNSYTGISQYVYLKECKLFRKTGWQNGILRCCNVTHDNYHELYFRVRETVATL